MPRHFETDLSGADAAAQNLRRMLRAAFLRPHPPPVKESTSRPEKARTPMRKAQTSRGKTVR